MFFWIVKGEKEEIVGVEMVNDLGVKVEVLFSSVLKELEKGIYLEVCGGVMYEGDFYLFFYFFMNVIVVYLKVVGVKFMLWMMFIGWES